MASYIPGLMSYVPEVIRTKVLQLHDTYNPFSAAKSPSQAHGKYLYALGMAYQSYGEVTHSPSWISSGTSLKVRGVMEMQAASVGKSAQEFVDMLKAGDPGVEQAVTGGVKVVGDVAEGAGDVAGDGAKIVAGGAKSAGEMGTGIGQGVGERSMQAGKGVGEASVDMGKAGVDVGKQGIGGLGKGMQGVGKGVQGVRRRVQGVGEEVGKGIDEVGKGVRSGLGGLGLGSLGRR
jgi:hypothetical protein